MSRSSVLLVDDDVEFASGLAAGLQLQGHDVSTAASLAEARDRLQRRSPDVALLDLQLPDGHGLSLLDALRAADGEPSVVVLTGHGTVGTAVDALKRGAVDFVEKPVRIAQLRAVLDRVLESRRMRRQIRDLRQQVAKLQGTEGILGRSPAVRNMLDQVAKLAGSPGTTVLVTGESGTGKELVARAIHDADRRRRGPFVAVNCAALTESLLESELFGYEHGSFTGGREGGRKGLFEAAHNGTLFLDEIAELELPLQAKLLRALQERSVRRVGGLEDREIDIRVIASTHRDLQERVEDGRFRQDLYYRLQVAPVHLAPLRERGDDVLLLAEHYVRHFADQMARSVVGVGPDAARALMAYDWPGNVRELRNVMEYAAIQCSDGEVGVRHLNIPIVQGKATRSSAFGQSPVELIRGLPDHKLATLERYAIEAVLEETGGNIARAARELGIHRQTLYNKIKLYELRTR
jgi:DNA-binding NtrC family response regulator